MYLFSVNFIKFEILACVTHTRLQFQVQQNPEKPILSSLESHVTESSNWQNSAADAGGSVPQNPPTQVANRKEFEGGRVGPKTIVKDSHVVARGGSAKMRLSNRAVVPENQVQPNAAANVEVLSQDSGLRGCWFRCKTLRSVQNYLKVQYYHVDDAEGPGKLEVYKHFMVMYSFFLFSSRSPGKRMHRII